MIKISGIQLIYNGLEGGYPFIEAILSGLPIVDEFLINEGGSRDKTLFYLKKLEKMFPKKIKIFQEPLQESNYWEGMDECLEFLIAQAKGDWIFQVQGDEIWHEKDILNLKQIINKASSQNYNSIRTTPYWCNFNGVFWSSYKNIRTLRKVDNLRSYSGGDDFYIGKNQSPRQGFTSSNVPPEMGSTFHYFNLAHNSFPLNALKRTENTATFIAKKDPERVRAWQAEIQIHDDKLSSAAPLNPEAIKEYPALLQGLAGLKKYKVRESLFCKEFLSKLTKIDYSII